MQKIWPLPPNAELQRKLRGEERNAQGLQVIRDVFASAGVGGNLGGGDKSASGAGIWQPLDADLTAIAALTSAADKLPYATGAGTWALATLTAAGRALIDDANAAAQLATLGAAASGANADITSMTGLTGGVAGPTYVTIATGLSPSAPSAGKLTLYASSANKHPYAINEDGTAYDLTATNFSAAMLPQIPQSDNTQVCSGVSDTKYATYLGKCPKATTSFVVRMRVTTAFVTGGAGPWAEIGIAKGTPSAGGNPSLTILGTTDVSGTFTPANSNVSTTVNATAEVGDDLWIVHGSKGTTPYLVRGVIADQMIKGFTATYGTAGAISTIGAGTAFTASGSASGAACAVYPQ